jgi:hypothetical protein
MVDSPYVRGSVLTNRFRFLTIRRPLINILTGNRLDDTGPWFDTPGVSSWNAIKHPACEKMGTGSGHTYQNLGILDTWPVPVPIFSQTQKWGLAPATPIKTSAFSTPGRCLFSFFHKLIAWGGPR